MILAKASLAKVNIIFYHPDGFNECDIAQQFSLTTILSFKFDCNCFLQKLEN